MWQYIVLLSSEGLLHTKTKTSITFPGKERMFVFQPILPYSAPTKGTQEF